MMGTRYEAELPEALVRRYFTSLIGQFYKILPIKESGEESLGKYMESLLREMIGCRELILDVGCDELYLRLLAILQNMIQSDPDTGVVRSEVFKAIGICKKLLTKYGGEG